MPFSLNDRVLYGLLAIEDQTLLVIIAALSRIEADPVGSSGAAVLDRSGRLVYAAQVSGYWLYYWINRTGHMHFVEIREAR